jgi:hypothetical protein
MKSYFVILVCSLVCGVACQSRHKCLYEARRAEPPLFASQPLLFRSLTAFDVDGYVARVTHFPPGEGFQNTPSLDFMVEVLAGARVLTSWRTHENGVFVADRDVLLRAEYFDIQGIWLQDVTVIAVRIEDGKRLWATVLPNVTPPPISSFASTRLEIGFIEGGAVVRQPGGWRWTLDILDGRVVTGPTRVRQSADVQRPQ